MTIVPEVPGWSIPGNKRQLFLWCAHCCRYHLHGYSSGHRAFHCVDTYTPKHVPKTRRDDSPYLLSGYYLVYAGALPLRCRGRRSGHPVNGEVPTWPADAKPFVYTRETGWLPHPPDKFPGVHRFDPATGWIEAA